MPGKSRNRLGFSGKRDSLFFFRTLLFLIYVGPVQAFAGNQLGVEEAAEWVSGASTPCRPLSVRSDATGKTRVSVFFESQEER